MFILPTETFLGTSVYEDVYSTTLRICEDVSPLLPVTSKTFQGLGRLRLVEGVVGPYCTLPQPPGVLRSERVKDIYLLLHDILLI